MNRSHRLSLAVLCLPLLTACGGGGSGSSTNDTSPAPVPAATSPAEPAAADRSAEVEIAQSRFSVRELVVAPGTTVTFVNTDAFAHTVTATADSRMAFDSGRLGETDAFERTFDDAGTYPYFCEIHPTMRATVIVE